MESSTAIIVFRVLAVLCVLSLGACSNNSSSDDKDTTPVSNNNNIDNTSIENEARCQKTVEEALDHIVDHELLRCISDKFEGDVCVASVTSIWCSGYENYVPWTPGNDIYNTDGIEEFTSLTDLHLRGNQNLTAIDVRNNKALLILNVSDTRIRELDVSNNGALVELDVSSTFIRELDVSANRELEILYAGGLISLDVSSNKALEKLSISSGSLQTLDLSANTALKQLSVFGRKITILDLSANVALERLKIFEADVAVLDLSANTSLRDLYIGDSNSFNTLDVSANTQLIKLIAAGAGMISVSGIEQLDTSTIIDLSGNNFDVSIRAYLQDLKENYGYEDLSF